MLRKFILFLILFGSIVYLKAQNINNTEYPEIGKTCPDFELQSIKYYRQNKARLADFKGKWLVMDFWNKSCGSCIASFPHMNELQKELGDKIQVMMVGIQDREKEIQLIYEKFRQKEKLELPCAFDSALANRFDIYTAPYIIVVDDQGAVRGITSAIHTTEMRELLDGKTPSLSPAYRVHEDVPPPVVVYPYDRQQPLGVSNNGAASNDFLFRSMLTEWKRGINPAYKPGGIDDWSIREGRFEVMGVPLEWLYHYAYVGVPIWSSLDGDLYAQFYQKLVLEIKDSSAFEYSYAVDNCKHIYSYSEIIPKDNSSREHLQKMMQEDLSRYFGFQAVIEKRKCPCWKVVATQEARNRLRTKEKGSEEFMDGNPKVRYRVRNAPFSSVLSYIKVYNEGEVIIDETGITGRIDMTMDCDNCVFVNSLSDVQKALRRNGLDLLQGEKEMKVLVIRDK